MKQKLSAQLRNFMLSVPFDEEIATDYYGGINEAYTTDRERVMDARKEADNLFAQLGDMSDIEIIVALPHAFSGRLSFENDYGFEYTAGQFYNIEVPQAVAAVLEQIKHNRLTATK